MPELILLGAVSLTAMILMVWLFLKLNQTQISLIQSLTQTNQSLLNQVRAQDIGALSGLQVATGAVVPTEEYVSTDTREMQAWRESIANNHELGEVIYDEHDLDMLRSAQ